MKKIFSRDKNKSRLRRDLYLQSTLTVARNLLGKFIVRKWRNQNIMGKIVETEAYIGPKDKASHAFRGKITKRNTAEYMTGGHIYIYLVYGMYWQLNISTNIKGKPECVLIRALEPIFPKRPKVIPNGPGKLCKFLKLNKSFYGEDLTKSKRIWLATSISSRQASSKRRENRGDRIKKSEIVVKKRIGIDYAGEWAKKPWRFYLKGNQFVSKK